MTHKFACMARITMLVAIGATSVQCQATPQSERQSLLTKVLQKADSLRDANRQEAGVTYGMAVFFTDDKARADQIQDKWRALDVASISLSDAQRKRASEVLHLVDLDACASPWPPRTAETDVINLKMVLNDKLFDTLVRTNINFSGGGCFIFLAAPKMSMAEVKTAFGAPGSTVRQKDGSETITYGVFKVAGDKDGRAVAVMFAGER